MPKNRRFMPKKKTKKKTSANGAEANRARTKSAAAKRAEVRRAEAEGMGSKSDKPQPGAGTTPPP
jgi:hypothetical protein